MPWHRSSSAAIQPIVTDFGDIVALSIAKQNFLQRYDQQVSADNGRHLVENFCRQMAFHCVIIFQFTHGRYHLLAQRSGDFGFHVAAGLERAA